MRVANDAVVLVADGEKMLFFRNDGDGEHLNLVVEDKKVQDNPAHNEQATDLAGGSMKTKDGRGGSMNEVDFHQQEEDRFAAEAADILNRRALDNEFESLIVVAPPKTLGEMRKHYHKELEKRIAGEIAKTLTGHPVAEIEKILDME